MPEDDYPRQPSINLAIDPGSFLRPVNKIK